MLNLFLCFVFMLCFMSSFVKYSWYHSVLSLYNLTSLFDCILGLTRLFARLATWFLGSVFFLTVAFSGNFVFQSCQNTFLKLKWFKPSVYMC